MIVDELIAILGFKLQGQGDAQKFQQELDKTAAKAEASARRITTAVADFGDKFANSLRGPMLAIGAIAAGATTLLGKNVITLSAQFEKYGATLETVQGSAEKAKASLDWAAAFAKKTPYDLAQVTEAFIKMRAYGLDPMDGSMTALGDGASAMGKTLMEAVEAMADAVNGEQERLKEFGITSQTEGDKITYSWNKNGRTFSKSIRKNGEEIAKFIREHMNSQFGGAMLRQSTTWEGMMSNRGDSGDDFQRRIGRGGFFEKVKGKLGDLLDYIDELDASGKLDAWSTSLSNGFERVVDQIVFSVTNLGKVLGSVDLSEKLKPFLTVMGLLVARVFPVATAFAVAALAFEDWIAYMAGADSAIGDFVDAMAKFFGTKPEEMAAILGNIATAAGWLVGGALGLTLFASALRSLSGALVLVSAAKGAVKVLGALAGMSWGSAAAGAAAQAGAAGASAGAAGASFNPAGAVVTGGVALSGAATAVTGGMTPAQRAGRFDNPMLGAMDGDGSLAAAIIAAGNGEIGRPAPSAPAPVRPMEIDTEKLKAGMKRHYGVSPESLTDLAGKVAPYLQKMFAGMEGMRPGGGSGLAMMASLALNAEAFMAPANQAKAMMMDMERVHTARIDADISPLMAKIEVAKQALAGLSAAGATIGRSAVQPRLGVIQTPGG